MLSIKQNFHRKTNGSLCNGRLARPKCGGLDHDFFLLLSYTTLTTLVRAAVKFRMLGLDDGVAVLAQLLAYGHAFCVIYALVHGLAREEHQEADNQLRYAGVSIVRTSESVTHTTLTQSDTAGKHHTLPSGTSCCESIPGLVPEKDFSKEKSLIRYSGVQHFHSNVDSLGHRSGHRSFRRLQSGTHVDTSKEYCLQRSGECRPCFHGNKGNADGSRRKDGWS